MYKSLGDYQKAIEYHKKALEIAKRIGNTVDQARCCTNLGTMYLELGDYQKVREYIQRALDLTKSIKDIFTLSDLSRQFGVLFRILGDYQKAIEYHDKALEIAKRIGDAVGESFCYRSLGLEYGHLRDYQKAIEYHDKALEIAKRIGDAVGESICYAELGIHHLNKSPKELDKALDYLQDSIRLSEKTGSKILEDQYKLGFIGTYANTYSLIIPLCVEMDKLSKGFEYLERSKSRALLEMLSSITVLPPEDLKEKYPDLLEKEYALRERLRVIQTRQYESSSLAILVESSSKERPLTHVGRQGIQEFVKQFDPEELDRIQQELDRIYDVFSDIAPDYVSFRRGKPVSFEEICKIMDIQSIF